jgi:ribonuclease BN (tRNA processing enzyme)
MIKTLLRFHPIGQGCFYSGILSPIWGNKRFHFVLDCGTDSKMAFLENEVNEFKRNINKCLDLLIISHFDNDHVNGVVKLLENIKCRRLIIPYYEPILRLSLYAKSESDNNKYLKMLENPINYFSSKEFDIEEIVVLYNSEDANSTVIDIPIYEPPHILNRIRERHNNEDSDDGYNYEDFSKSITTDLPVIVKKNEIGIISNKSEFIELPYRQVVSHKKQTHVKWEFIFYLEKILNTKKMEGFRSEIDNYISKHNISLIELFKPQYKKDVQDIYKKNINKKLNNTSLVTYHGPVVMPQMPWFFAPACQHLRKSKCGTLLTGDLPINSPKKIKKLRNYFDSYMDRICIYQIPHHGSKTGWGIKNPEGMTMFNKYIICHGLNNKFKHPSIEVVNSVKSTCSNGNLVLINEATDFFCTPCI